MEGSVSTGEGRRAFDIVASLLVGLLAGLIPASLAMRGELIELRAQLTVIQHDVDAVARFVGLPEARITHKGGAP